MQRGFSDENPVVLEETKEEGGVEVEHGLPPGEEGMAGEGRRRLPRSTRPPAPAPAARHGKKGKK